MVDWISIIVIFSAFTQSASGFGFGLVAMPILLERMPADVVVPLVALMGLAQNTVMTLYYQQAFQMSAVFRLAITACFGIPCGLLTVQYAPRSMVLMLLGLIVAGYALYSIFEFTLPQLQSPRWAYGFGFVSGWLMGGYNLSGPPVILYGENQRWSPTEFRGNLAGFFLFSAVLALLGHGVQHRLTPDLLRLYLRLLPGLGLGICLGTLTARYLNPNSFRKVILYLLVVMGLRLVVVGIGSL